MGKLVEVKGNTVFTTSKIIAEGTGNKHHAIQQIIQKYQPVFKREFGQVAFEMRAVKYSRGVNSEKVYLLTEGQATFLMTLLRNDGVDGIVVAFKARLASEFIKMRNFIFERQSQGWIQTREQGKLTRKAETDVLKRLVEYAKEQGYSHKDELLYINYTKLANKICGVSGRDNASMEQLSNLTVAENIILHCIDCGIQENKYYKDIYQDCKKRLEMFKDIAYLEVA